MGPPRLKLVPRTSADGVAFDATPDGLASGVVASGEIAGDMAGISVAPAFNEAERNVSRLAAAERAQKLRIVEAVLFAAPEPIDMARIAQHLGSDEDVAALVGELREQYAARGINLVEIGGKWAFRTAEDLSFLLQRYAVEERRLSRAALETLSIIAYHQPVTRAEIEEVRGVSTSAGTIDVLLETGWIRPRGRRRAPGRPVTYGTTQNFLDHFGLASIKELPGLAELKGAGLLDATLPPGFSVPEPTDVAALMPDELPLDSADDEARQGELTLDAEEPQIDGDDGDEPVGSSGDRGSAPQA